MQEHDEIIKMHQIESLMKRPVLYNNIDGVGEVGLGIMFLGSALLQWLPIHASWWHRYGSLIGFLLLITAIHYGVKGTKMRITYPRTGYVEYRRRDFFWRGMVGGAIFGLIFGVSFSLITRWHSELAHPHWSLTMPAALFGLIFATCYAYGVARAVRWKLGVAVAMAICSIGIAMLPPEAIRAMAGNTSTTVIGSAWIFGALLLIFALYGVFLSISGGVSLVLYLRHSQPAETAE